MWQLKVPVTLGQGCTNLLKPVPKNCGLELETWLVQARVWTVPRIHS